MKEVSTDEIERIQSKDIDCDMLNTRLKEYRKSSEKFLMDSLM